MSLARHLTFKKTGGTVVRRTSRRLLIAPVERDDATRIVGPQVVVISPHLDDAVLSLGSTISAAARAGARVTVLTVFAGDPANASPAGPWDAKCGFATAGEAAERRREEDGRALALLGATPTWLSLSDSQYEPVHSADVVIARVAPHLESASCVLLPGHPLLHSDHRWLSDVLLSSALEAPFALYVEQPYASTHARKMWRASRPARLPRQVGRGPRNDSAAAAATVRWVSSVVRAEDRRAKELAIKAYKSQFAFLGSNLLRWMRLYEAVAGGEPIGRHDGVLS